MTDNLNTLERISRFSCRFPWLIFVLAALFTGLAVQQIKENAFFEADLIKFLPTDMTAVKSDDYSKKNFNTQDTMLVGIEHPAGTVLEPELMRAMENVVLELKVLKAEKTFDSLLKGEKVTLSQSVGIDPDSIISIANLEDAILDEETGSVVTGSVVKNLKKELGISSKPGEEERLPDSDADLQKIIPGLKDRVVGDRTFKGSVISEDMKSATIRASTIRKQVYKKRYALLELSTALDAQKLKNRFQGQHSDFPFTIYGKTVNKILIDDAYIIAHSKDVKESTQKFLSKSLKGAFEQEPKLQEILAKDITPESLESVLRIVEKKDFFLNPKMGTWRSFMDELYEFTLKTIDPFSRENLEFQIHDVADVVDMAEIYYLTHDVITKHLPENAKGYVAGSPVVIGVLSQMMAGDMGRLVPIAIGVVLFILVLSFKSVRGVIIPLVTVALAVLWTLGLMAYLKIPFTISTSGLPIIILAVGTAYSIHLLNRYYEDSQDSKDRFAIVQRSIKHVGGAIFMAAVTTIAGFSSLATTSLTTIQHFGIFSAVGVLVALILSISLTPAMLVLWKIPKRNPLAKKSTEKQGLITQYLVKWSQLVIRWPRTVLLVFLLLIGTSAILMRQNHFEGSIISTFKEDNIIFQSDKFLNKHLTGTTDINLIFSFRDQISLENPSTVKNLQSRIYRFSEALRNSNTGPLGEELAGSIQDIFKRLPESQAELTAHLSLLSDVLNEEYVFESVLESETQSQNNIEQSENELDMLDEDLDSLDELSDDGLSELGDGEDNSLAELADDFSDTEESEEQSEFSSLSGDQISGLMELTERLNKPETSWEDTAASILALRETATDERGVEMMKSFNLLNDFLSVDIKQPIVLHKLEEIYSQLKEMENPVVVIDEVEHKPSGMIISPVDYVRKFYKVFYHNDDPAYDRIPDVETDGFEDKTLTDRSIIGVVLNQALSADRDGFEAMITPDLKEFQVKIMIRDGSTLTIDEYVESAMGMIRQKFPENDPYISSIKTGGAAFTGMQISLLIGKSQMQSIALSFLFVFMVTFFIFRSFNGGLFSLIPLLLTVAMNFGFLALLGGEITMSTMLVASVAIGIGVDYTIHFLERFKLQLRQGDSLEEAYTTTVVTSGKAILVNATAVAAGFLVFLFSTFESQIMLGTLVAATMLFSSLGALTLLPAVILKTKPSFLSKFKIDQPQVPRATQN